MSKKVDTILDWNAAPVSLKKPLNKRFFAYKVFFRRTGVGKTKNAAIPPQKQISGFFDRMKAAVVIKNDNGSFAVYDIISL